MSSLTRRDFVRKTVLAAAAVKFATELRAVGTPAPAAKAPRPSGVKSRLVFLLGLVAIVQASAAEHRFAFGSGPAAAGALPVRADSVYASEPGYGFEAGAAVTDHGGFCTSERPFFFSVDLPEGNYRVTLTLGDRDGESHTVVKAESRRLMLEPVNTKKGEVATVSFVVNLRTSQIPGGGQVRLKSREIGALHWDKRLTLEFNGARPCVAVLDVIPVNVPTVFIAGDSTVTDQQLEPYAAWGQMLPAFFGPTIAIANHAESGESIRSFVGERRLERVLSLLKAGDYLFLQFAHNDQKAGPEHLDAATGYKDYVRRYVSDARAKGAFPVLVTSMERRNFDAEGKHIVPSLGDYPQAIREVGTELNVPVVDLNAMSVSFYESLGAEAAKKAFVHFPANSVPGQEQALADDTHFSSYGAYELAKCVVEGIKAKVPALAAHLRPGLKTCDPAHPAPFADWHLPVDPTKPPVKPEGS